MVAASKQLKRLKLWHYRLMGWLLANPQATLRECAAHFAKSPVWISLVANSPNFRDELLHRSELISRTVADRTAALASLSLNELIARIEHERDTMPLGDIRETLSLTLRYLGYRV